ncbi:RnfH family protein [Vibrio sp. HA2012]|uniref:RnfH family protein n=1 Tax=Vibrio sp. HA2012 TaxID=1971595 RepID=UPI000C2B65F9|nr:RnfH family protein [Vibrio sp. HA2012]PJC86479.1 RnfH family protein [Vibrio sp. HA2012]
MNTIRVEVVYALPYEQKVFVEMVESGSTVEEIIRRSGVLEAYPEIDLSKNNVGIYSRNVKLDMQPQDKDRIEIYRPLQADPKEIRRRRAEQARVSGTADPVTGGKPNVFKKAD